MALWIKQRKGLGSWQYLLTLMKSQVNIAAVYGILISKCCFLYQNQSDVSFSM